MLQPRKNSKIGTLPTPRCLELASYNTLLWLLVSLDRETEELRLLKEQLVTAQRERLRQLYEQEFQEWEARLRDHGLTIERPLD